MNRFYFGWYIVVVSMISNALLIGISFSSYGIFVVPVSRELGLSRADMSTGLVLMNVGAAISAPFLGKLFDKLPLKPIILVSVVVYGGCLMALATSSSVSLDCAILLLGLPTSSLGFSMLAPDMLLSRWFKAFRARAMSLSILGWPLGTVIVPPIVAMLIRSYGWRVALAGIGLAVLAILIPLNLFIRERPRAGEVEPTRIDAALPGGGTAAVSGEIMPIGRLLGSMSFCGNVIAFALASACMQACQVNLVPLALHSGHSEISATSLVSLNGAGALISILVISAIADRFSRAAILLAITAIVALMTAALLFSGHFAVLAIAAFSLGAGNAYPAVLYTLLIDRFGRASFGTMLGLATPVLTACCAAAYLYSGAVYDATGDYHLMLSTFVAAEVIALALFYFVNFGRERCGFGPRSVPS